ncbi:unnamed protein product [Rotaria sp. Silwood1]|nr:unnamed protein product [Rotaria sp. Silwood1]CAF3493925.1 unnamed protein product [Rotaria sp. Silwood1]CAF4571272.1 unnamed protein product [Rotaria sp. Silwood1]CAF4697420.1 unnamed protein product [Rotaria sp. Silwood1]
MIRAPIVISSIIWLFVATCTIHCWPLPRNVCNSPFALRDSSKPTTVVGNGQPGSCNQNSLSAALLKGGIITFNCGGQPVEIAINTELQVSKDNDTVIDGAGIVTLNGLGITRILKFDRGDFRYSTPTLTIQRLRFINGRCQDSDGGCAILQKNGGTTIVVSSSFENNIGPTVGQDVAGGAIWTLGGGDTTIVGSVFQQNKCSNGGALGILGSGLYIYNSHFQNNQATGNGGNPGNGGNGGAISFDGRGRNNTICGTRFTGNQANKYGGAFFRVSYNGGEQNNFDVVLVDSNFISKDGNGLAGGLYIQGGSASILNTVIANNSADGAGGLFLANEKSVTLNKVNFLDNKAYTGLGAAVFCSSPVSGTFSGLTVANNNAGAFGAAFAFCSTSVTLSNSIIANNTVGNPWPANACTSMMNDGTGVIQSPNSKQSPANGADAPCTNGSVKVENNISVELHKTSWTIQAIGAQVVYSGPTVVPGL